MSPIPSAPSLCSLPVQCNAVAGEAAGLGMGLLAAGSGGAGAERVAEMLAYAHDTAHEKIIRGLALGLALASYGREESAEGLVEQMTRDQVGGTHSRGSGSRR